MLGDSGRFIPYPFSCRKHSPAKLGVLAFAALATGARTEVSSKATVLHKDAVRFQSHVGSKRHIVICESQDVVLRISNPGVQGDNPRSWCGNIVHELLLGRQGA